MIRPKFKKYDLVLVNTPARDYAFQKSNDQYPNSPLGLGSIATYLDGSGWKVGILDAEKLRISVKDLTKFLQECNTRYVGFNAVSENIKIAMKIAKQLFQKVILGGVHASLAPEETINRYSFLYALVHGEGEMPLDNILREFPLEDIKGVAFERNGKLIVNLKNERIDLDTLHPINRKFFEPVKSYFLMTSRGCPHNCAFCASPVLCGRIVKFRSMKKVVAEMKNAFEQGHSHFHFLDDQFLITSKRAEEFLKLLKRSGLYSKITWRCMARSDILSRMNDSLLQELYKSGGRTISIGIESGCKRILRMIHKKTTNNMVVSVVKKMTQIGWTVKGFFILGFPSESYKEMIETKDFIMELGELGLKYFNIAIFRPYPGTEIYGQLIGWGYKPEEIFYESSVGKDAPTKYVHGFYNRLNRKIQISMVSEDEIREFIKEIATKFIEGFGK